MSETTHEAAIKITAKLYGNRDAVRRMLRQEYEPVIAKWRAFARDAATKLGCEVLQLPMRIKDDLAPGGMRYLLAAVVDEVEAPR